MGIILAGGDGTRLKAEGQNKTTIAFNGKPMISYGVELFRKVTDDILIVIGAHPESVKRVVGNDEVHYAMQYERKGTGHAVSVACSLIREEGLIPETVMVGYGDHMMFYTPEILKSMYDSHIKGSAAMTLVSTTHEDPDMLAWGRVIRDSRSEVTQVIEQKDSTPEQRSIQELNAGFYCFEYAFLAHALQELTPSEHTGEYYITDLVDIARRHDRRVIAYEVPFAYVGMGINTPDQLVQSQSLHQLSSLHG